MFILDTCCTLVPYFEVPPENLAAFKALGAQFLEKTRNEVDCIHYAFSFSDNIAHCREGYANAEGILKHLENVTEPLGEALKLAKLIRLEIHAPEAEVEKLKAPLAALKPQFFILETGIRRQ